MAEFAYNNNKNASISHMLFELNHSYHLVVSFKKETNLCFKLKATNKLSAKLQEFIIICQKNFHHSQNVYKEAHKKSVKFESYNSNYKDWLNNKYIKTK